MNVLFLSNLTGNLWAGPNHSVPAQVLAQSKIDNVMWINLNRNRRKEWSTGGLDCKNLDDFPSGRLRDLPPPFNHPDVVVVEETYCYPFSKIIGDIQKANIPYVIVPRSTLTTQAQHHRRIKKVLGNLLYFRRMFAKAAAIQYLTEQEREDSSAGHWNSSCFVIPNGINMPENCDSAKQHDECEKKIVYIGRLEMYQKGLDFLLDAVKYHAEKMREDCIKLYIYGPDRENTKGKLEAIIAKNELSDVVFVGESLLGKDKDYVLREANAFIMTSRFEGLPMGMLEALAYGLPCFATRGTNMIEVINHADAGWTAETEATDIIKAFGTMMDDLTDDGAMQRKKNNAYSLAQTYSWDHQAERLHEELIRIVKAGVESK